MMCVVCGKSEPDGTKKIIIDPNMVEAMNPLDHEGKPKPNFTAVIPGENDLVQLNHRLPVKVEGARTSQRGMCE